MSFENLGINPNIISAIKATGFESPTPVQNATIPKAILRQDLVVSAQTGSGKTAAFILPILNHLSQMPKSSNTAIQVLILTPTRELAMQITKAASSYGSNFHWLRMATIVGGMPYQSQIKALSKRIDILVATPGRLIDQMQSGRVNLKSVHTLVLDEADRMLDMGFIEDIQNIVSHLPKERQTMLFSATLDNSIMNLAKQMMNNPERISLTNNKQSHSNIEQKLIYVDDNHHKIRVLQHLLNKNDLDQAVVFTSTKRGADELANHLADIGFAVAALHGDMNQRQRTRTLAQLQKKQLKILIATDVAARGIDIQGISHAINFDLPMQAEDYIHRIGRTGRAGRNGEALTLASHSEKHKIRRIEHYIGKNINITIIEGLESKAPKGPSNTLNKRSFANRKPKIDYTNNTNSTNKKPRTSQENSYKTQTRTSLNTKNKKVDSPFARNEDNGYKKRKDYQSSTTKRNSLSKNTKEFTNHRTHVHV
ncbi:superfamily II DNA and RNA helicase [Candidatus Kinetoplastibacterium desouzaii TCC079E]|uniref:Superfamily II DNA and RNA helicase n=1 Tax=Candidatus Kinetoplastidibacterium desouzai TCC079E TaxID=1208919 RepID=M1L3A0_9PROT|nr:DEAD/DEAH box helicase [Candidatus Kinetoplastibacterium desouzaii]AGF47223.1 superfamily II DNA and RNA helicase [Candidatus Kinetoplastibacterium desouzaii TCC079E]